ncbi:hypothetical protein VTH82DRAFT_7038 [Thermothelomyces myriococcoides]
MMNQHDTARFGALVDWSQQHGARLHPSVEIYLDPASKYSLRVGPSAAEGLQPGFAAVSCPARITLSYLNALVDGPLDLATRSARLGQEAAAGAFPPRFTKAVPPYVLGRFFLIKEYLKGKDSFWWPYIATLPSPEQVGAWALPPFWPDHDIAYLEGTNAHVAIQEIQENVKREFKQARKLLKEEDFPDLAAYTQLLYKWAYCIFTSRSFRPSLIFSDAVKQSISALLPPGVQVDDFSVLQPLLDIANHSPTAHYTWDTTSIPDTCQLICHDHYPPGAQVYNNYGFKTNSELLLGYGFILPETPSLHNDYVHVRKRAQQQQGQQQEQRQVVEESQREPNSGGNSSNGGEPPPQSFLISLRPMTDPSSLAGLARLASSSPASRLASLPCFAHFEPALVDDLAGALATADEKEALHRWDGRGPGPKDKDNDDDGGGGGGDDGGAEAAVGIVPEELRELVDKIRGTLAGKVQYDYGRLMEVEGDEDDEGEEEGGEGGLPPPANRNQALAVEYRHQCAKVLLAALEGLAVEDGLGY